jgi:hypothetical protein
VGVRPGIHDFSQSVRTEEWPSILRDAYSITVRLFDDLPGGIPPELAEFSQNVRPRSPPPFDGPFAKVCDAAAAGSFVYRAGLSDAGEFVGQA